MVVSSMRLPQSVCFWWQGRMHVSDGYYRVLESDGGTDEQYELGRQRGGSKNSPAAKLHEIDLLNKCLFWCALFPNCSPAFSPGEVLAPVLAWSKRNSREYWRSSREIDKGKKIKLISYELYLSFPLLWFHSSRGKNWLISALFMHTCIPYCSCSCAVISWDILVDMAASCVWNHQINVVRL